MTKSFVIYNSEEMCVYDTPQDAAKAVADDPSFGDDYIILSSEDDVLHNLNEQQMVNIYNRCAKHLDETQVSGFINLASGAIEVWNFLNEVALLRDHPSTVSKEHKSRGRKKNSRSVFGKDWIITWVNPTNPKKINSRSYLQYEFLKSSIGKTVADYQQDMQQTYPSWPKNIARAELLYSLSKGDVKISPPTENKATAAA